MAICTLSAASAGRHSVVGADRQKIVFELVTPTNIARHQAIWHGALKLLLYGIGLSITLVLSFTIVGAALGLCLTALFLAYDGFDYPLDRRQPGFWAKWRYLVRHPGQTVGYSAGTMAMYMVPLAALVAPSFAAVGATLAYLDAEKPPVSEAAEPPQSTT